METLTLRPEAAMQVRGVPAPAPALAVPLSACPGPWDALLRTLAGRTQRFQCWTRGVGRGVSSQPRPLPERHFPGPVGWGGPDLRRLRVLIDPGHGDGRRPGEAPFWPDGLPAPRAMQTGALEVHTHTRTSCTGLAPFLHVVVKASKLSRK